MVADFDHTLTKMEVDGRTGCSSFKVVRDWTGTPKDCRDEGNKLFKKYYPQESDPTIPPEDKLKIMTEWFT